MAGRGTVRAMRLVAVVAGDLLDDVDLDRSTSGRQRRDGDVEDAGAADSAAAKPMGSR